MIDCIHSQITMMKLLLLAMIFVGFEIQDNLADDCSTCLLDKHCGPNGECLKGYGDQFG